MSGTKPCLAGEFYESMAAFSTTNVNPSINDIFVTKLTDMGTASSFAWTQRVGGTGRKGAVAVAASGSNMYAAGVFESPPASKPCTCRHDHPPAGDGGGITKHTV